MCSTQHAGRVHYDICKFHPEQTCVLDGEGLGHEERSCGDDVQENGVREGWRQVVEAREIEP